MNAAAAAEVEDAVRRYFESGAPEDAGGPVLAMNSSTRAVELGARAEMTIHALAVVSVTGDKAHVELDAVQEIVEQDKRGRERRTPVSISGPLHARREHGRWKVVDHMIEGRAVSERFVELQSDAVRANGVSARLTAVYLGLKDVIAFVEIENHGAGQLKIGRVVIDVGRRRCDGGQTRSEFEPGSSSTVALAWRKPVSPDTPALRVTVVGRTPDGRHASAVWAVDLNARTAVGSIRERRRLRVILSSPLVPIAFIGSFFAVHAALFGPPPVSVFVIPVLLFAFTYLHPLLHRR